MDNRMTSEAAVTLAALEACRDEAMLKLIAIDADRPKIAYDFCMTNSVSALQRWRSMDDEGARLTERVTLYDCAIQEARERASHPDYRAQWQKIFGSEFST
jgi:hypothetical protein